MHKIDIAERGYTPSHPPTIDDPRCYQCDGILVYGYCQECGTTTTTLDEIDAIQPFQKGGKTPNADN